MSGIAADSRFMLCLKTFRGNQTVYVYKYMAERDKARVMSMERSLINL